MLNAKEYDEMIKKYNENEVLKDLCDLHFANGLHTGKWEDESAMDESAEEYLATMVALAEKYNIKYDKVLSNYVKDKEYEAECYTMDYMGSDIQELVEKHLLELLTN